MFGDPQVPVLSLHGIGDLLVPLSQGQTYAREVAAHGESNLLVHGRFGKPTTASTPPWRPRRAGTIW